jgi:hypothetical protein
MSKMEKNSPALKAVKGSPIPLPSNKANPHPIAFCEARTLPSGDGLQRVLGAVVPSALSVQLVLGISCADCRDDIAARTHRARALRAVDCDHHSFGRKG